MKLRIYKNSVRFRLVKPDVERLATIGSIVDHVQLGPFDEDRISFGLESCTDLQSLEVEYRDRSLLVRIPRAWAEELKSSDRTGYSYSISFGEAGRLEVLIEKDFKFRSPRGRPEEEEAYPHPGKVALQK